MSGPAPLPVVVLISGGGTNLQALIDAAAAGQPFTIAGVVSNRPDAFGLTRAARAGIATAIVDHTAYDDRESFEAALAERVDHFAPQPTDRDQRGRHPEQEPDQVSVVDMKVDKWAAAAVGVPEVGHPGRV